MGFITNSMVVFAQYLMLTIKVESLDVVEKWM
jgi:hypothetical protein